MYIDKCLLGKDVKICETGLWKYEDWLGVSPDGLVKYVASNAYFNEVKNAKEGPVTNAGDHCQEQHNYFQSIRK